MTGDNEDHNAVFSQVIVAFFAYSAYLSICQIDATSAHFAVSFNIPAHNISIYFDKLYSIRCLLTGVGCLAEYLLYLSINTLGEPRSIRIYISIVNFSIFLLTRIAFLIVLYSSSNLGYYVYLVLAVESFFGGCFMSIMSIVPEHSVVITFGSNICRLTIPLFQMIIDRLWYHRPLVMIRAQGWLCVILTFLGLVLWIYYTKNLDSTSHVNTPTNTHSNQVKADFFKTFTGAFSPLLMFALGSMFKDFLYPGTLPYAVLERSKSHMINMMASAIYPIGSLTLFLLEREGHFEEWSPNYDAFWLLLVPTLIITIFTFLAIHTRIPSAMRIRNSQAVVMVMTLSLIVYHSYMYQLSFTGVAKVVYHVSGKHGDDGVITFNVIMSLIYMFLFSKLSVGYNVTRVSLGYHLPKYRPNHRMSKFNTFCHSRTRYLLHRSLAFKHYIIRHMCIE
ncbi:conserved hypothetical protein [Theileria orientalis strain Shintoku]|uniref:Uncharacterized protein n=1 Tax=Theileria orientalis strain Shintoku TaxID=869250 RepID=J4DNX8_THEOR|nr:conserved hypothetical protein [Theileria orientalis strain Shintoku]BAM39734.1 conserved hypothetical protein [Theileria orientalis strain Shintoku]|eukprot:XP_009690035.1 conserved hypothetical protein [Theileria orientalis strain Shintoku]